MMVNYFIVRDSKFLTFLTKLKLTFMLWFDNGWKPVVKFNNGVELDFQNKKIILREPLEIVSEENIKIKTAKHLMLESGQTPENNRYGYKYSIWFNSPSNENGEPIQLVKVLDQNNNIVLIEAKYDFAGNLIIPKGYLNLNNDHNHDQ